MDALHFKSLLDVSRLIGNRDVSSVEVTEALLGRIGDLDGGYHSYVTVTADHALERARIADSEIARGIRKGPLHGVPLAVKDLCYTTFAPTGGGTAIHRDFKPGFNATVVDRLEQAGAVLLGKLSMTEGAYTSHHPSIPTPINPWNAGAWVGSSSTGSGVATSAGLCFGSLGSDTGGSIRLPSATCGLTGIKPTWGRVSRHGVFPLADSLDHVGPMTRNAADAAAMLQVIAGADPNDPTTLTAAVPDYLAEIGKSIRGLTIGIDRDYIGTGVDPEVAAAMAEAEAVLTSLGARIVEVTFPTYEKLLGMWIAMCAVETAAAHAGTYPSRGAEYGPELKQLIDEGYRTTGIDIAHGAQERLKFNGALAHMFETIDIMLIPALPFPPPTLAKMTEFGDDPAVLNAIIRFTALFDFSGSPTITVQTGLDRTGMPLSMQFVGPLLSEAVLIRAAHAYQTMTDWHTRHPIA